MSALHPAHHPVLLPQVLELLAPQPGAFIVDATLGYGGHSAALLAMGVELWGLDRDPVALASAQERLSGYPNARFFHASYSELPILLARHSQKKPTGILMDLGVSSPQLDTGSRGFSFRLNGPLDMRMNPSKGPTAADCLEQWSEEELSDILFQLGEERNARRIARAIKAALKTGQPIQSTLELAELIAKVSPAHSKIHPATKSFQAIRIAVNQELEELDAALATFPGLLVSGGRLAIISFHSLEDRRVKERFRSLCGEGEPVDVFGHPLHAPAFTQPQRKALKGEELDLHPRARSARLRVLQAL
jgi:16S rRNA (cytosine1402-N4)-methyltransferase